MENAEQRIQRQVDAEMKFQRDTTQQQEIESLKEERDTLARQLDDSRKMHAGSLAELSRIREGSVKLPVYKARLFDNNLEFNVCRVIDLDTLINEKGEK